MTSPPVVRDAERDLTTGRHQALGSLLGRVWPVDQVGVETLGLDWMPPERFRFGASSLLNDVLMQIRKERTGRNSSTDYFTIE